MNADHNDIKRPESAAEDHRRIEDDLPGFALGCLDRESSDRVSDHLAGCESCRSLLHTYEETVGMLAFGVPQSDPPDALKERLMRRIEQQPSVRVADAPQTPRSLASFFKWFSPALAMASLVIIISLSSINLFQWQQSRTISHQLAAPLTIFKMRGTPLAPHADGTFVIGQNPQEGVLVASDLPSISSDQQFQLWLIRNGEKVNGGAFSTTPMGYVVMPVSSSRPLPDYQSAIVTVEPSGGSPSPTGPEMMSGVF